MHLLVSTGLHRAGVLFAVLGGLCAGVADAGGQARQPSETIASDRPGLGDGAHILASGVFQLEVGFGLDGSGGERLYSIGQAVARIGLAAFELRLYPNSFSLLRGNGASESGFQDIGLGVKVPLGSHEGGMRTSVVAGTTLPTGGDSFTSDEATGFSTLVLEGAVSETVGLAVNLGYSFQFDDAADGAIAVIVTPGFPISGVDGLSGYSGYAGFFNDGDASHILEAGLAYLANADTQLDVNGGWDAASESWFVGLGMAIRRR